MIRVKNIYDRNIHIGGVLIKPGETRTVPEDGNYEKYLCRGWIRAFRDNVRIYERHELEKKKMSELRKIGAPLGAKDTKKSELIEEILNKQE